MQNNYEFELDLKQRPATPKMEFVTGDKNTGILNITLTDEGTPINLSGCFVQLNIRKADSKLVMQDNTNGVSVVNATAGLIKVILQDQSITAPGDNFADVSVIKGTDKVTTKEFKYFVRLNKDNDDAVTSSSIIPVLDGVKAKYEETLDFYKNQYDQATKENVSVELTNARIDNINNITYDNLGLRLDALSALTDDITGKRIILGVSNGNLYYKEVI